MNAITHAKLSAHRFGGGWEEWLVLHNWFDSSKSSWADYRHRAILHNQWGVDWATRKFGSRARLVAEHHVREDLGRIPTTTEWVTPLTMRGQVEGLVEGFLKHPLTARQLAERSAKRFGGFPEAYLPVHELFFSWAPGAGQEFEVRLQRCPDPGWKGLAGLHHSFGIFLVESLLGPVIQVGAREVPTRLIGEHHVRDLFRRIPTVQDWFKSLRPEPWMQRGYTADEQVLAINRECRVADLAAADQLVADNPESE